MSLIVACPKCSKKYKVGDDKAGKKIKCAACGAIIAIPAPAAVEESEADLWDLPPAEDRTAPPPPRMSPRGGAQRPGSKGGKKTKQKSGGMPTALKIVLIIFGVLGGITVLGCGGCYIAGKMFVNKLEKDIAESSLKDQPQSGKTTDDGQAILEYDVERSKSDMDAFGFFMTHRGKFAEVKGVCNSIRGEKGAVSILIGKKGERFHVITLQPFVLKDQSAAFSKLFPGQTVTLRGKISTVAVNAKSTMDDCEIIKVEGPPLPAFTDTEIAEAFAKLKPDELEKKFKLPYCVVTGTIAEITPHSFKSLDEMMYEYRVTMQPSPEMAIKTTLSASPKALKGTLSTSQCDLSQLKVGDRIKVCGPTNVFEKELNVSHEYVLLDDSKAPSKPVTKTFESAGDNEAEVKIVKKSSSNGPPHADVPAGGIFDVRGDGDPRRFLKQNIGKKIEAIGRCGLISGEPGKFYLWLLPGEISLQQLGPCLLKDQSAPYKSVFPEQIVTIRGTVNEASNLAEGTAMLDAEIIKVEGAALPEFTAEAIAADAKTKSVDDMRSKYQKDHCILVGTITKLDKYSASDHMTEKHDWAIEMALPGFEFRTGFGRYQGKGKPIDHTRDKLLADPDKLKVGNRIKLYGRLVVNPVSENKKSATLVGEQLISIEPKK